MNRSLRTAVALVAGLLAVSGSAFAQSEPPGRVARLAFTEGVVSFHDDERTDWTRAVVNTPLTSGDSLWTEPGARSEISLAGTRVRLDGATQLDLLAVDDSQTRLQVSQGRIDVKTFTLDTNQPYQIVTPRGTITLQQQGDYYVEAGSTQDPTRLGVRSGAASIQSLNGQTLAVRAGEVGEILGDAGTPQLRTINTAPPPMPAYWAARDRQVVYDTPQYVNAGMTGYEDLNAYGTWDSDPEYGRVWYPRTTPANWAPYRTGKWQYVKPWGWTWVDEQPWGFAPYHYGRWANRNNRWAWVPPERETRPVYAPALVAFIGGVELSLTLGQQNREPVGWFPLAPRETYVPSYTANRDYYNRINRSNRIQEQALESRWQAAQRREAFVAGQNSVLANQRFATVVPSDIFVRSQPVARATIQVPAAQLAAAPVAPVAAPPAPTASIATAATATAPAAKPADPNAPAAKTATPAPATAPGAPAPAARTAAPAPATGTTANVAVSKTAVADMPTLAKPAAAAAPAAPGPKIATAPAAAPAATVNTTGSAAPAVQGRTATPPLQPRVGNAPPKLDEKATVTPGPSQAKAPAASDTKTPTAPTTTAPTPPATATPAAPTPPPAAPNRTAPPATATPAAPAPPPAAQPNRVAPPATATPAAPPAPATPAAPPAARTAPPATAAPATPAPPAPPAPAARPAAPAQAAPAPTAPAPQTAPPPVQPPQPTTRERETHNNAPAPRAQPAPVQQAVPPAATPPPAPVARPAAPAPAQPQIAAPAPTPPAVPQRAAPTPPATQQAVTPPPVPKPLTDVEKLAEEKKKAEEKK